MELFIKLLLIADFLLIFYQDFKSRAVYWFLFPLVGCFSGWIFYHYTLPELFLIHVLMNLAFVSFLLLVIFVYSTLKLKVSPMTVFGLGDVLLFLFLCFTFSTISFIIVFVSALAFALIMHLFLKHKSKQQMVPLAGHMSLFFCLTYLAFWSGIIDALYII